MTRIVFVTVDAGGNLPPALAIAGELRARGHEVHFLGHERQRAAMETCGIPFTPLASLGFWNSRVPRALVPALLQAVRLAADRAIADEVQRRLGELDADLVVVDCLMASAALGAKRLGGQTAVLFHTFLAFWQGSYASGAVGALARLRGVAIRRAWDRADLRLAMTDRTMDPAWAKTPGAAVWLGPTDRGIAARQEAGKPPLVLASLSTTWFPGQTKAYQRIAEALGSLPVRGVITTGGLDPDFQLKLPPNVQCVGRVGHAEIMPQAALVIGHGGHSTAFTALAHGLPLVVLPMHPMMDQPMVGRAIAQAGAGIVLGKAASPERIAGAVRRILDEPAWRIAAGRIGEKLRAADPAAQAAERILAHVSRPAVAA